MHTKPNDEHVKRYVIFMGAVFAHADNAATRMSLGALIHILNEGLPVDIGNSYQRGLVKKIAADFARVMESVLLRPDLLEHINGVLRDNEGFAAPIPTTTTDKGHSDE